jgi:hypothetical protein
MQPFFLKLMHAFLHDEMAFRRWMRGLLFALVTVLTNLLAVGEDIFMNWTLKQWVVRIFMALLAFAAGTINLGDKTTPDRVQKALDQLPENGQ